MECRIGQICDSSAMITGSLSAPAVTPGHSNWQRAADLVSSGVYTQCLRLRDEAANTRRLLPVLAVGTLAAGSVTLWSGYSTSEAHAAMAPAKKDKSAEPAVHGPLDGIITTTRVAGAMTVALGVWGASEHLRLINIPSAYAQLKCDEVINAVVGVRSIAQPVADMEHPFQGLAGYCSGAAVLMGDCVPQRHVSSGVEWSNEPLTPQQVAVGAGVLVLGALALYTGVAGVAAAAEVVSSWGWVPVLAL